jgi:hypothetical protein
MARWIVPFVCLILAAGTMVPAKLVVPDAGRLSTVRAFHENRAPQPKVEIAGALVYDFGRMPQMRRSSHTWEVKNVGNADLILWMESSTTSITIANQVAAPGPAGRSSRARVKPNDMALIELEWETKNFINWYMKGCTIGTNDPNQPIFSLRVKGMVYEPVIVVDPAGIIRLNGISNEEVSRAAVAVYAKDVSAMKVTKIRSGRPELITAKQTPLAEEERKRLNVAGGYRIEVEIKPGLPPGKFSDTLMIETNHPLEKETMVSIQGYAVGPIRAVPERLSMKGVDGASGATRSLSLVVRGGKPVKFEVVQKPDADIGVAITPYDGPNQQGRYRLTVTVPPGTPPARFEEEIILKTDHPRAAEIKIPVSIIVTNSGSG